jgi:hypothetical protein
LIRKENAPRQWLWGVEVFGNILNGISPADKSTSADIVTLDYTARFANENPPAQYRASRPQY